MLLEKTLRFEWRLSWQQRGFTAVCGCAMVGLLVVAGSLDPDPRGLGTHQQLGLPPCTIQSWCQLRCPSCGMTTSWAHFVRGDWTAAGRSNSGGLILALAATLASPWLIGSAIRGRWLWARPVDWAICLFGIGTLIVTLADWALRVLPVLRS